MIIVSVRVDYSHYPHCSFFGTPEQAVPRTRAGLFRRLAYASTILRACETCKTVSTDDEKLEKYFILNGSFSIYPMANSCYPWYDYRVRYHALSHDRGRGRLARLQKTDSASVAVSTVDHFRLKHRPARLVKSSFSLHRQPCALADRRTNT